MKLFQLQAEQLQPLQEIPFALEKDIQQLVEAHLATTFHLKFIKSEFSIKNYRIDTLAFDEETQSFVIIEYKRKQSHSVVDQGYTYLNLLLEYKGEFIAEYNESQGQSLKRADVDWSQSRIVFIAPSFTDYNKDATNFNDMPFELWEIKQLEGNLIYLNPIKKSKSAPSIAPVQAKANTNITKVLEEIKVYTEDDHLANKSEGIKELYDNFKEGIVNLVDDISIVPKKLYISFEKHGRIIVDIAIQTQELKLYINIQNGRFHDAEQLGKPIEDKTKWGRGYYQIAVTNTDKLEYIMSLIKQAL